MTISMDNLWIVVLAIVLATAIIKIIDGILRSVFELLYNTVIRTLSELWHRKGGIGDKIAKKVNSADLSTSRQMGFVDRTKD